MTILVEIMPNLFIGNIEDYEKDVKHRDGFYIVHACKDPYHREALGYKGRGAPKDHSEYLYAKRGNRLICNMVDALSPRFFDDGLIYEILRFVDEHLTDGKKVLIHCNQGHSRAPVLGLLYMKEKGLFADLSFSEAEQHFLSIYHSYDPKQGIRTYAMEKWGKRFLDE